MAVVGCRLVVIETLCDLFSTGRRSSYQEFKAIRDNHADRAIFCIFLFHSVSKIEFYFKHCWLLTWTIYRNYFIHESRQQRFSSKHLFLRLVLLSIGRCIRLAVRHSERNETMNVTLLSRSSLLWKQMALYLKIIFNHFLIFFFSSFSGKDTFWQYVIKKKYILVKYHRRNI